MLIYTIIVTYNGSQWVDKCFTSLVKSSIEGVHHILVIDNGSLDNTVSQIKENFPSVHVIETGENLGFGQANNLGIKEAIKENADSVFLLNQDAWVEPTTIQKLIDIQKECPEYGIISPLHMNGEGDMLDSNFSKLISRMKKHRELLSDLILNTKKTIYPIEYINAAIWLLSTDCIRKVGLFSEFFFHYGEDENYCRRVNFHDFKIGISCDSIAYHDRESILTNDITIEKYTLISKAALKNSICNVNKSNIKCLISFVKLSFVRIIINLINFSFDKARVDFLSSIWVFSHMKKAFRINNKEKK